MRKKNYKTILAVALATVMLTACGSSEKTTGSGNAGASVTTQSEKTTYQLFPEFETVDLEGNSVDTSIFAEKDLTVVNVWGTFCGPCINEMPELEAWNQELSDNVQIIGLICDVADMEDTEAVAYAKEIVDTTGITYQNLLMNGDFEELSKKITGVPTTIFVSSEGHIVQRMIVGADVDGYKETVARYLKILEE